LAIPTEASEPTNAVEQFKQFIEHPPPLEITYQCGRGERILYRTIWQSNAFVWQTFPTNTEFLSGTGGKKAYVGDAAGFCGNEYWGVTKLAYWWWQDTSTPPLAAAWTDLTNGLWYKKTGLPSPARSALSHRDITFSRILCGGIWEVPIGTMRWSGDSFSVVNRRNYTFIGKLFSSNGLPARLEVTRIMPSATDYYTIIYSDLPSTNDSQQETAFFPRKITSYYHPTPADQFDNVNDEIEIRSLQISENPFPEQMFASSTYWHKELKYEVCVNESDKDIFREPFRVLPPPFPLFMIATRRQQIAMGVYFLAIIALLALSAMYSARGRRPQ
jgi:hypothetical protein